MSVMAAFTKRRGKTENAPKTISRRYFFRHIAVEVGSVALLLCTVLPAAAKMAQKAVGYRETPKGDQSCSNCSLFSAPSSCTLVDGTINPQGWCRFHQNKS